LEPPRVSRKVTKESPKFKIVFFGTPEFAVPSLKSIISQNNFEIVAVISQTSKAKGRGAKIVDPEIVELAKENGITNIFQPKSINKIKLISGKLEIDDPENPEAIRMCETLNNNPPDIGVVVAYGKIIPDSILNFPKYGLVNLHPSDLPRWRGAAPLQHTLFAGDKSTRICIIKLLKELDAGPILNSIFLDDISNEDLHSLQVLTANQGADLLVETLNQFVKGTVVEKVQSTDGITYAHKWEKSDSLINWKDSTDLTLNRIRASYPTPGAFTFFNGKKVKIFEASTIDPAPITEGKTSGELILIADSRFAVMTEDGLCIEIKELQMEGKKRVKATDFLNSNNLRSRLRSGESIFFTNP